MWSYLGEKKVAAGLIYLRLLKSGLSSLSQSILNATASTLIKGQLESFGTCQRGRGPVTKEVQVGVKQPQVKKCQKLEQKNINSTANFRREPGPC